MTTELSVREAPASYVVDAQPAIRKGYKQTEVGVIPEDWQVLNLESITDPKRTISYGIVQTGPSILNGVSCLRVVDIADGKINTGDLITTSKVISDSYKRTILKADDLVMPLRGKVGDIAIIGEDLAGSNLTRGVALIAVRADWSARYCRQYVLSSSTRNRLEQSMNGSALQEIPIATLRSFKVALPPTKAEQEAIAEALSDADALIDALEKLIAKKRHLKQGAMQELLTGKKRLPGFGGEWVAKTIKSIVQTPVTDGPHLTPKFIEDGIPFLSVNNLVDNKINFSELRYISRQDDIEFSKKCKPRKGDVLLGKAASVGKVAIVDNDYEFNIWSPIALIRVGYGHNSLFVFYQLLGADLAKQIALLTNSSSQGNIGMGDIEKLTVLLPPPDEQTAIATTLSDMDTELAALESQLAKARGIKQGMMQELLTGRIRLV